jgi:imidazolonepropionase
LLTLRQPGREVAPRRGAALKELGIISNGAMLCDAGRIVSVGTTRDALRDPWIKKYRRSVTEVDCRGGVVLPGFVDSHTHPGFVSPRLADFEKRIAGATYEEIAAAGGGIRSSVAGVRGAAKNDLARGVLDAFTRFSEHGTTTVEAKSGYGLSLESELKSLEAFRDAAAMWAGTVVTTLLGAHVLPEEFEGRADDYVKLVCDQMIPQAAKRKLATCVDVFCDRGAFDEQQSLQVLAAAQRNGLSGRAHVSQLVPTKLEHLLGAAPLSLDHLDFVADGDIALIAKSGTIATLLPGANYFLGLREFPPARKLIDSGAAVALATDYNPGTSPILSMPFILSLACTQMKISPAEAISAAAINGAWALRLADRKGSLEAGKDADAVMFDITDYRELCYWVGRDSPNCVIANGTVILGS